MSRFRMSLIDRPEWACESNIWMKDIRLADYHAIQKHRELMLKSVHNEVEDYLNTDGLYFEGDVDRFPNRSQMTGEYYVSDENYESLVGPVRYRISIMCHCLGRRVGEIDDYLGLEVWLACDPQTWMFEVFRNTDSSSI